ncbi:MAG: hypothetical protein FWD47_11395 [Treponema sp.]|nr:hypothetical protein [Treponema sp.]
MRKAGIIIILALIMCLPVLSAQDGNAPSIETDWDDFHYDLYAPGDQTFIISLGITTPMAFIGGDKSKISPSIGGAGSLIFNYYLTSKIFIGAEATGLFLSTVGNNTLFVIPVGARIGTQFIWGNFEFPVACALGISWRRYLNFGYVGLYTKVTGSAFYRLTNGWSFGLTSNLYWLPEFRAENSVNGIFMDFTLSARYHF